MIQAVVGRAVIPEEGHDPLGGDSLGLVENRHTHSLPNTKKTLPIMRQGKYKLAPAEQKPSDFPPISGSFSSQANYKGKDSFLSIGRMHRKKTRRSGHFRCPLRRVKAALFGLFAVLQGAQLRAEILQLHGADLQVGQALRRGADRPALHQTAVILPGLRRGGGVEAQRGRACEARGIRKVQ